MTKAEIEAKIKAAEDRVAAGRKIVTGDDFDPSNAADQKAQADYEEALTELGGLKKDLATADASEAHAAIVKAADDAVTAEFAQRGWQVADKKGKSTDEYNTFRQEAQKIIQGKGGKFEAAEAANIASLAATAAAARIATGDIAPDPNADKPDDKEKGKSKGKGDKGKGDKDGDKDADKDGDKDEDGDGDKDKDADDEDKATGENEDGIGDGNRKEDKGKGSKMDNALDSLLGYTPAMLANPEAEGADNLSAHEDNPDTVQAFEHLLNAAAKEESPDKHSSFVSAGELILSPSAPRPHSSIPAKAGISHCWPPSAADSRCSRWGWEISRFRGNGEFFNFWRDGFCRK